MIPTKSPSYFSTDLRRLQLVDLETLCQRDIGKSKFFQNITDGIVLSIPEAQNMSGGDYDGDEAWICTHKPLLDCLPKELVAKNLSVFTKKKAKAEKMLWEGSNVRDWLKYAWHFRNHQGDLGTLANKLDLYVDLHTFDDPETEMIGVAAFRQVRFAGWTIAELLNVTDYPTC
jgi:RNA dependent RNA polymerase